MSSPINWSAPSLIGRTVYSTLDRSGLRWDGTDFVTVVTADWADYVVAMTDASCPGYFVADLPEGLTLTSALDVTFYLQAGVSAASTDPVLGFDTIGDLPFDTSTPIAFRDQTYIENPTVMDALSGAWVAPYGRYDDNSAELVPTFVVYAAGGTAVARTFGLNLNPNGLPIRRA